MLVTIARTEMAPEAHILRGRLEAEGIPAFIQHEHHVTMDWLVSNALGGVRLQVPVEYAQEAVAILRAIRDGELKLAGGANVATGDASFADDSPNCGAAPYKDSNPACPDCGKPGEVRWTSGRGLVLALLFFQALPWPWRRAHWQCSHCARTWSTTEQQPFQWTTVLLWILVGSLAVTAGLLLFQLADELVGI
ncbi:MAG: DUF2007 domain-containing protein [Lysobacteraceae bacterium]|nr:DUF2007 domain-containing protein [Xanthomonadales bacterium]HPF72001.1 DUF2007 domain-containing protein [Xanthomonadaceae bacterium]HRX98848.1 DUF2007 domain-containing protein [Xanthomonadaceae bacterium]